MFKGLKQQGAKFGNAAKTKATGAIKKPLNKLGSGIDRVGSYGTMVMGEMIDLGADKRAANYVRNGGPSSNKAAQDTLFGRLIEKSKPNGFVHKMTANGGYTIQKEAVSDNFMDELVSMREKLGTELTNIEKEMGAGGLADDAMDTLTKKRESIRQQIGRADGLLNDPNPTFTRDTTGLEYMKNYYDDPDFGSYRKRATAAGIAGVGVAAGLTGRVATGGSLTHNGNGERDIIGVPFL